MRVRQGRGDWRASTRIEGLLRYAFIGDSHTFGAGVAPDQTLAANFEKQANAALPGWAVEAVNLGVNGYNLWNSWLSFKQVPQVFDGIVLTLCNNDADLFGRTLNIRYAQEYETRWESEHPFGALVVRCFNEIAEFSQQHAIPVAVVFSRTSRHCPLISETLKDLCASRGFCYVDGYSYLRERNFTDLSIRASAADFHPSERAHDAIGRFLTATVKRAGWFGKYSDAQICEAPARVVAAAISMAKTDRYPPDAALNWGLRTLETKSQVAQRLRAIEPGVRFDSGPESRGVLMTANRLWHMTHRLRAFIQSIAFGVQDLSWALFCSQNERSKLEEICFAVSSGDWERLAAHSLDISARWKAAQGESAELDGFAERAQQSIQGLLRELQEMKLLAKPAAIGSAHEEATLLADIGLLEGIAARLQLELDSVLSLSVRVDHIFNETVTMLSDAQRTRALGLVGSALNQIKRAFEVVSWWPIALEGFRKSKGATYTTIEVTVRAEAPEGPPPNCLVALQMEYAVPFRLCFNDTGAFWPDGSAFLIKLHVPLLYQGRMILTSFNPSAVTVPIAGFEILKVEVYNHDKRRRTIDPESFLKDAMRRFISPIFYLM